MGAPEGGRDDRRRRARRAARPPGSGRGGCFLRVLVLVVGRGRLGSSLAAALQAAGHKADLVRARDHQAQVVQAIAVQQPRLVLLAIPDQAVAEYAASLRAELRQPANAAFVHLSGALQLSALDAVREVAGGVGSFHPLQSFSAPREPEAFRGILIAVDASNDALLRELEDAAASLGARPRRVTDDQRAVYHGAAVMASNYLVALAAESASALERIGWSEGGALQDLLPLMEGTIFNLSAGQDAAQALTGPIRRGDVATVRQNLAALDDISQALGRTYRILGLAAVDLAVEAGLDTGTAAEIRMALTDDQQRPGGAT